MIKKILLLCIVFILFLCTPGSSNTASISNDNNTFLIGQIQIGKSTIDDVQAFYGATRSKIIYNDSISVKTIEYCFNINGQYVKLIFESSIMGNHSVLTGFHLQSIEKNSFHCKTNSETISTNNGIYVGQKKSIFFKKFPFEFKAKNENYSYEEVYTRQMSDSEFQDMKKQWPNISNHAFWDVLVTIKATFKDNKLTDYHLRKVESY